jgi:hypothetical protein
MRFYLAPPQQRCPHNIFLSAYYSIIRPSSYDTQRAGDDWADMTWYNPGRPKLPEIHRYDCAGTKFNLITGRIIRKVKWNQKYSVFMRDGVHKLEGVSYGRQ